MIAPHFCPSCGFNFEADKPISVGPWFLAHGISTYRGKPTPLSMGECALLYSLAAAKGATVRAEVLLNRISDSDDVNLIRVVVVHIRRKLGALCPIETARGYGYRWRDFPTVSGALRDRNAGEAAGSSTLPAASDLSPVHSLGVHYV